MYWRYNLPIGCGLGPVTACNMWAAGVVDFDLSIAIHMLLTFSGQVWACPSRRLPRVGRILDPGPHRAVSPVWSVSDKWRPSLQLSCRPAECPSIATPLSLAPLSSVPLVAHCSKPAPHPTGGLLLLRLLIQEIADSNGRNDTSQVLGHEMLTSVLFVVCDLVP